MISRALAQEIRIGNQSNPTYLWGNSKIVLNSPRGVFTVDVLGNELSIDEFTATVRTNIDAPLAYSPKGKDVYKTTDGKIYLLKKGANYGQNFLTDIAPSTPVYWYVGGSVFAKGYFSKVERIARHLYKITCQSGIGLLQAKTHTGGLYNGQTAETLLSSIIGNTFTYSVDNDVKAVTIYGHLPYDTARNNLHKLLFAIGAAMIKRSDGNYNVEFLKNTLTNVPQSRVALSGKTQYVTPADSVEVTEHSFYAQNSDEVVSLFDNSNGASVSGLLVLFDNPMHDLAVTGNLTIDSSGVNHAYVSGVGTLTGKKYTHNSLIVRLGNGSNNVKRVSANELVSFANSYYVASRVMSYYSSTKTLEAKIQLDAEKCGNLLAITDSFRDATNAYLSKMEVSVTTIKLAQCKMISGFQPSANGNNFTHKTILTADATWRVPSGVTRIRIVLIGGAQGGQGGYDGTASTAATEGYYVETDDDEGRFGVGYRDDVQPVGIGGAAGAAGAKAAFLVSDQNVQYNDAVACVIGVGGNGGAHGGVEGDLGTPSTAQCSRFGTLSSADGLSTYEGYNDPISGITYAIDGVDGIRGGDGGRSCPYGNRPESGARGENISTWSGGQGGAGYYNDTAPQRELSAGGGGGGGAAYGSNGGNGTIGSSWRETRIHPRTGEQYFVWILKGGDGGNGANATAPSQPTIYGQGGAGGNGGGGGGNKGGCQIDTRALRTDYTTWDEGSGTHGTGGLGSSGSKGGNGCIIIYY